VNAVSNLSDLLDAIGTSNTQATKTLGAALGLASDISGPIGLGLAIFSAVEGVLQGDQLQNELQNILTTIQNDFHQLNEDESAKNIIQTYQELDDQVTSPSLAQFAAIQSNQTPDISLCVQALEDLAINSDAFTGHWQQVYDWQIFWTDSGEYYQNTDSGWVDAGYGQQTPPQAADQVFSYRYVLPDLLRMIATFIAVAGTVDANWVANYKTSVLTPVANFLKNNVHDTILGGITQLSPGSWNGQLLGNMLVPSGFPGPRPWPGVSQIPLITSPPPPVPQEPTGANIEFGAVEIYSGFSSMANYQISFQDIPVTSTDASPYNKFQIRLYKRAIDVYIGVGLLQVWNVTNILNALTGDPPMPRSPYTGWSFRQILQVSNFQPDPKTNNFSLFGLAKFIKHTLPLDTDQGALFTSFQELLNH
jgi:hypothetical protein